MKTLLIFALLALVALPCSAQLTQTNLDDTLTNWQNPPCIGPPCAGGVGNPASWDQTINNVSPSVDGFSMLLTETGTNYSNVMWPHSAGPDNAATYFTGSFSVYIPSTTPFQSFGPDMYQFIPGASFMFGTECDLAGAGAPFWHVWDELHGAWIATSAVCTLTAGSWHTVVLNVHRIPGDLSCSGHPCEYYDSLIVDGISYGPFSPQPAGNRGVPDDSGMQFDLNSNSTGGTLNAYIDRMTYKATIGNPVSADDLYCPSGSPSWGTSDGPAILPTLCYNTAMANTPAPGAVVNVTANSTSDLQTKLTNAVCGQQITLPAGSTYGQVTYPALACPTNNYVWIQTSGVASLPPEGTRTSPCYSGVVGLPGRPAFNCPPTPGTYTAQIKTTNSTPAIKFTSGASGVRLIGLELTRTVGAGGEVAELILTGNVGNLDHLIFDRIWCHGDENQDETNACFRTSAVSYVALIDSYANNFYCISGIGACTDAKVVGGGVNTTNSTTEVGIKIVNNFLEAAGETIIFGGGSSNTTPADVEIRLNSMFKPLTWNPADPSYNGGVSGHPLIVKNLFEMKNVQRLLLEGNTFTNVWAGFSQVGEAWAFTPKDQSGTLCPICKDINLTLRYNTVSSANQWGQFTSVVDVPGGGPPAGAYGWSVHDNVVDNLRYANCYQCPSSSNTIQNISGYFTSTANVVHDASFNHNTLVYASTSTAPSGSLGIDGPTIASGVNEFNITFTNNVMQSWGGATATGTCPNTSSCSCGLAGANAINACWSPKIFGGNCFINNGAVSWPGSNVTSVASFSAAFVSYNSGNKGNYVLSSNACQGQSLDGSDPGANIGLLNSVLAGNPLPTITGAGVLIQGVTISGGVLIQ